MPAWTHAILPLAVIVGVVLLAALGKFTSTETISTLSLAAGLGALTVARKDSNGK